MNPPSVPTANLLVAFVLLAIVSSGCTLPYQQFPASGVVYGQAVQTHVDSELAAYYLGHFHEWRQEDTPLARVLAKLPPCSSASLGRDALQRLSQLMSVDVAGLYAADCLMQANEGLAIEFGRIFSSIQMLEQPDQASLENIPGMALDHAIVVVPGWDYIESGSLTGADFARQLEQFSELGIANYRVPIDPAGGVEENAVVIRSELARISRMHEHIMLVSASSGGPAVALVLGDPAAAADVAHVRAWLNIGGILGGMRLIDRYSEGFGYMALRVFTWIKGWDIDDIRSMSAERSHERIAKASLPAHIAVVNYIGIPFSGDISSRVTFFYSRLREDGPNDGLTLVADPILPGTHTIVALGQDHFFADDPELESRTLALASVIARVVARKHEAARLALED